MSIIDDKRVFLIQTRESLEAQSKRLIKEQCKGNKSNLAEALTDDEVNMVYKKYLQ